MAIKYNLHLLMILLCIGCNTTSREKSFKKDSSQQITKIASTAPELVIISRYESKILGIWTDGSTENATFDIRKDSIYYVDQFKAYSYSLKEDSIKIHYSDFNYAAKIHFLKDTLVMDSKDYGVTKYWKFKN